MASAMQAANGFKQALLRGGPTFGVWQTLPGANLSRAIARSGVEWICIDTEHGNIDATDAQMHESVAAIAACGVSPIVRIPANEAWMIKRALDAGAHAILVPLIKTAEDVRRLVSAAKFPPLGSRGFGSPFSMEKFAAGSRIPTATEYLQQANDALATIVQIETAEAYTNIEEIAQAPGVDMFFVGPFDLGNNIGYPILDGSLHEELKKAIGRIFEVARKAGKATGIYCTSGEQAKGFADMGFNMISVAADMIAIPSHIGASLKAAKGSTKDWGGEITGPYGR
ncbi:HpcH/HpaI aldolase/citrate lyase family protein [Trichodelitschia bisporula]|uniref:HpcH/HpaI aldolase/citrate lyase family protein n=1 Tax=Trichodelitschia bisporula TaxID=703511 RepID=A0A6G1HZX0_9PEZI|nr:HpcH/HpaI aldolase/citrate lyase family protein [Trichodelitschia bisporula]